MLCSIVGCVLSIAYLVASTELDLDLSKHYRINFGAVHGYYVENSATMQGLVLVGTILFLMGYLGAKLVALVILINADVYVAVGWCSVEALGLLAMRYLAEGTWRHHIEGLSGVAPSLVVHVVVYMSILATPFPFLRYVDLECWHGTHLMIE